MSKTITIPASQVSLVLAWLRRNNIAYKLNQDTVITVTLSDTDAFKFNKILPTLNPAVKAPIVSTAKPVVNPIVKAPVVPATKPTIKPVVNAPVVPEVKKSRFSFKKFW